MSAKTLTENYYVQGIMPKDAVGDYDYTPYYVAHEQMNKLNDEVIQAHWLVYKLKHMKDHECEEMEGFMEYLEGLNDGYVTLRSGPVRELLVDREEDEEKDDGDDSTEDEG